MDIPQNNRTEDKKLVKVTLEYKDHIQVVEGEEANKWINALNACIGISRIHGLPMIFINWITEWKMKESIK